MEIIYSAANDLRFTRQDQVYCFARGNGDTFNAFIHALSQANQKISNVVVKQHQLNLFLTLAEKFQVEVSKIYVVENTTDNHYIFRLIRLNNPDLDYYLAYRSLGGLTGIIELIVLYWTSYKLEGKIDQDLIETKLKPESWTNRLPEKCVLLTDYSVTGESYSHDKILSIKRQLEAIGYTNFVVNQPVMKEHYNIPEMPGIDSVCLTHAELIDEVYARCDLVIVGPRSGLFDIIRFSKNRAIIIYNTANDFLAWWSLQRIGAKIKYLELFEKSSTEDEIRIKQFFMVNWDEDYNNGGLYLPSELVY